MWNKMNVQNKKKKNKKHWKFWNTKDKDKKHNENNNDNDDEETTKNNPWSQMSERYSIPGHPSRDSRGSVSPMRWPLGHATALWSNILKTSWYW